MLILPPWSPNFGTGVPGANTPLNVPYFDNNTNPFTPYIYEAGAWHKFGAGGSINATSLQGVAVDSTVPTDGQVLTYNGTKWKAA